MLAMLGLLGCVGIIIGAAVAVAATVTSTIIGVEQMEQAEELAADQEEQLAAANAKAEERAKVQKRAAEAQAASNLLKTQQAYAGAVALNEILAERTNRKSARERADNLGNHPGNANSGGPKINPSNSYDMGMPKA